MLGAAEVKTQITNRLERAYQLAFFILGNQEASERIAVDAVDRLQMAVVTQDRRYYYIPQGSSRQLSRSSGARSKVTFNELHLLQRLIFDETEVAEKEQEYAGFDDRRLLIHFLKHLVRITIKRNSFYVSLGVTRLLHHYPINEAIALHSIVMQNPSRAKDNYYWRSRKGQLLQEIKSRFGNLLTLTRGAYGEERFIPRPNQASYADFVIQCLQKFMPWETQCPLPPGEGLADSRIPALEFDGDDPDEEHRTEVARMHSVLHPRCFGQLVAGLGFSAPATRLDLPEFFHNEAHNQQSTEDSFQMTETDHMNSETMRAKLEDRQACRQSIQSNPHQLKILVDRQPRATLDTETANQIDFRLLEGEEFIEIRASEEPDICLALYPIDFQMLQQAHTLEKFVIKLSGGQKLNFTLTPERDSYGELTGAVVSVNYAGGKSGIADWLRSLWPTAESPKRLLPAFRFALPVSLLLVAGLSGIALWRMWQPESPNSVAINNSNPGQNSNTQPTTPLNGGDAPQPGESIVMPPNSGAPQRQSKPPSGLRDHDVIDNEHAKVVESPSETRKIFLSLNRDVNEFRSELSRRLKEAQLWELTDRDEADTAMDISLSTDGQSASLRLLNAKGRVIWPRSGKSQKYTGSTSQISERIVVDLKNAAGR